ncbi:helix-turn-helix transcriptional regulator [Clostridium sp. AWRP]|uniref:helix-turn-helix transcriptional regulator n=1 Tax=Clostridium sp. AWRP TaxID=2212991 RepID=UPI000FD7BCED|nr:helix-turn-helix transcriptional regulator [Clostridium sp. AWRP]AZV56771.1 helix-turn-helix domain-containing protein [Clostridium sp. AWRP]
MVNRIAYYRKKSKISQDQLAKSINISRQYLSKIENNKANPAYNIVLKISKFLRKDVNEIFFENNVNHDKQTA